MRCIANTCFDKNTLESFSDATKTKFYVFMILSIQLNKILVSTTEIVVRGNWFSKTLLSKQGLSVPLNYSRLSKA
jgi:hypothetical protein